MASENAESEFVRRLADAPTLDALPDIVDPNVKAPLNPPAKVQQKFVGASYVEAYSEAERFVDKAFQNWPKGDITGHTVLDFGSGWGRITRTLLRRLKAHQVWSSDVDAEMTVLLHSTLPGVNAVTNAPMPPTVFGSGMFDAVTAFSVFSHLSEDAHRRWAKEFARVTRVGSKVFITVLEENFVDQVVGAQAAVAAGEASRFATNLAKVLPDALASREEVRQGAFVYANGGADDDGPRSKDFYAWAVAPRQWVDRVWGDAGFAIESWTPTGELFDQAMVVLVRRDSGVPRTAYRKLRRTAGRIRRRLRALRSR